MKLDELFVVSENKEKKMYELIGRKGNLTYLVAATVKTNILNRTAVTRALSFPNAEAGLLAIMVRGEHEKHYPCFVEIKGPFRLQIPKDNYFVEIDKQWIPSLDRPGQMVANYNDSYLIVEIEGKIFASKEGKGNFFVPDADLLCRYLYGTATADEVKEAARLQKVEELARIELPKIQSQLEYNQRLVEQGIEEGAGLRLLINRLETEKVVLETKNKKLEETDAQLKEENESLKQESAQFKGWSFLWACKKIGIVKCDIKK